VACRIEVHQTQQSLASMVLRACDCAAQQYVCTVKPTLAASMTADMSKVALRPSWPDRLSGQQQRAIADA
jgi:hypothetical protein